MVVELPRGHWEERSNLREAGTNSLTPCCSGPVLKVGTEQDGGTPKKIVGI